MKNFLFLFLFISCAKVSYIAEQGIGQLSLEYNDIDNTDFINDSNQKKEHKEKVKVIQSAKKYFFDYFGFKSTSIYDEVKILDQDAVTYLVIHSPNDEIKAMKTSFPFVGSFPYLGFFSLDSAKQFKKEKEEESFHTYMRPVYAYSTLNNPYWPFHDNILSSFFFFSDKRLTELIFHELVHTIVFVGNNVGFNENLAQFIAKKLMKERYSVSTDDYKKITIGQKKQLILNQFIVSLSKKLNSTYKKSTNGHDQILASFLKNEFIPKVKSKCSELEFIKCWPLKESWNNARFAALGTYEAKRNEIEKVFKLYDLSLKDFVLKIIDKEKAFNGEGDFLTYLEKGL